jgi:hypothetical protein
MAFLLSEVGVSQESWQREVYLLSGVEAVVFAAVGWLFGKEVHREQAEKAEANAQAAEAKTEAVRQVTEVKTDEAHSAHMDAVKEAAAEHTKGLRGCLNTSRGRGWVLGSESFWGYITSVREVLCGGLGLAGAGRAVGGG